MKFAKAFGLLATAGLLLACATAPLPAETSPAQSDAVAFHFSLFLKADGRIEALRIEMRFNGDEDGVTAGRFQAGVAGVEDLLRTYTDIKVSGGVMKEGERPGTWTIEAPASAPIVFSYLLRSGIDGLPTSQDQQPHAPWILDDLIYVYGQSAIARLDRPNSAPATFEWSSPPDIVIASDLELLSGPGAKGQLGDVRGMKLIAGRDVRVLRDGAIRLAIAGKYLHSDEKLFRATTDVIRLEREFWGDPLDTPYLVTLGTVSPEPGTTGSVGGMGGSASSGIAMLSETPWLVYLYVLAHEVFHTWNWFQMGPPSSIEDWFNEGFTDYYARALLLRAGLWTIDEFADDWNQALLGYARTPTRERNTQQGSSRFDDPDSEHMLYLRGALMAAVWDRRLRDASSGAASLDDAMREIRRRFAAGAAVSPATQLVRIAAEAGVDIKGEMVAHLEGGEPIVLAANAFGPCFRVEAVTIPSFDRGFDYEASVKAGMVATGVRADGPAFAAGLREGMRIVQRVAGRYPDSTVDQVWIVQAPGASEQTLRWKPAGDGVISTQRLVRVAGAASDAQQCGLG